MKRPTQTNSKSKPPDKKMPVFLRLHPSLYDWLKRDVATGKYFNVQEKIVDVLRDAQEADRSRAA